MFIDASTLSEDTLIEKDICIIGAGAAGITLARELIGQPYEVCLLESGGLDFDETTQSLYGGENVGVPYFPLKEARARYLGGSTNLWGGWSRPLDKIDFEDRPWMPYSGWPFTRAELVPYYERAQKVCNLGPFEYDFAYWKETLGQLNRRELSFVGDEVLTYLFQIIPPTHVRFGQVHRTELEQARNITTYLQANVVEIEADDMAQTVKRVQVASLEGKKFWVSAKVFILASGGIENPRLLLASNKVQRAGLGNEHDLVGRFFMEHPYLISGKVLLSSPACLYTQRNIQVGEIFMGASLGLSKEVQEREQILNFCARVLPLQEEWIAAFNRLRFALSRRPKPHHGAFPTITEGQTDLGEAPVLQDLGTVLANFNRVAARTYAKLFDRNFYSRKSNFCSTHLVAEQAPNPDSRVTLSNERDRLGMNRVQLDWRLSPIDKYTIQRSQQIIAAAFNQSGLAEVQTELTDDDTAWQSLKGSYHHMGTTRMSLNPRQGVVDEHCQVHGINNLYIAGSSVFPTGGLSNPTLTIVALAIRLADRLKSQMGHPPKQMKDLETVLPSPTSTLV